MTNLPVILLHAFPLNCALWADQAAALRAGGYDVRTPDFPGFGASPVAETQPDLDVFAGAVLGAADAAGFERFALAGLSMGGYTAMAVLRRAPERVAALILADTRATADSEEAAANRRRIADELEAGLDLATFARAMIPTLVGQTTLADRVDVVETVRGWIEANDPRGIAWAQRAMAARPDSVATLRAYDGPALIVWGEEDTLTGRTDQDLMLDALDDVELAMIPNAGHLTAIEAPDAVTGVLLEFLASA